MEELLVRLVLCIASTQGPLLGLIDSTFAFEINGPRFYTVRRFCLMPLLAVAYRYAAGDYRMMYATGAGR